VAVRDILEYPDPRLREPSLAVDRFDDSVAQAATDLIDTLHASRSIGLSAPQIDDRRQILVMDHSEDQSQPEVYINPEVLQKARSGFIEERCLSVPDVKVLVMRATEITVRAQDIHGETFERELSGMPAVCLQHELDHFDGKLLVDRMNWFRRRKLNKQLAAS
jgi:peptide deformylase